MELDAKKIGIYVREGLIFSIRVFYKSAHDHPFVLGMVIFSFLLYRFLPSVFAFLVSSSPVLFCTAVLLGTLLSFGNPDIPEVEEDEKKTEEISSLKTGGVVGNLVVEKDESFAVETCIERREVEEKTTQEAGLGGEDVVLNEVEKDAIFPMARDVGEGVDEALISRGIPIEHDEKEHHIQKEEIGEKVYIDHGFVDKQESDKDLIKLKSEEGEDVEEGHHAYGQGEENGVRADEILNLLAEKRVNSSLVRSESDSDSDGAESSSPDASMADIMPMLDELHPLLDSEAPQPTHIPINDSDAGSEDSSHESDEGSAESGEDVENQEEAHEDHEDNTEAVVKWTEDDQKNLMDLGTSELERNRRLENLIAKRMARKHHRIAIEKNLIDLDNNDLQPNLPMSEGHDHIKFHVPPISTARRNPFDFPYDSSGIGGLLPIPGSAPSVLLPRRNPFDLPFEQVDDRGSLTGETSTYQEEFMSAQERDVHFRRHGSFTLAGPFSLDSRKEKHDIKLKPYFVLEGFTSGEASRTTFQRQLSQMSDSKLSSVPDTDSGSSVAEEEQEHISLQDLHQEGVVISPIEGSAEPVERGNNFKVENVEIGRERRDIDIGDVHDVDLHASEIIEEAIHGASDGRGTSSPVPIKDEEFIHSPRRQDAVEVNEKSEVVEENYKGLSSSSSEANEKIFEMNDDKELGILEELSHDSLKGSSESIKLAHEGVDSDRVEIPVYDLSPSPSDIEKSFSDTTAVVEDLFYMDKRVFNSTSSISSDTHMEVLDTSVPSIAVERSSMPGIEDTASDSLSFETKLASGNEVSWVASSSLSAIEENELQSRELMEIGEHDVVQAGHSEVHHDGSVEPMVPKLMTEQVSQGSWETKLVDGGLMDEKENQQSKEAQFQQPIFDEEILGGPQLDSEGTMDAATVTYFDRLLLSDASLQAQVLIGKSATQLPSEGAHEETEDISALQIKSTGEINDGDIVHKQVQEPEAGVSSMETEENTESSSISKSEQKSTTNLVELNDDTVNRLKSGQELNVNVITEDYDEAEEIKDMDEGLLSELDAVGDFSVGETRSTDEHIKFDNQTHVDISTDSLIETEECKNLPEHQLSGAPELQLFTDQSKLMEAEGAHEEVGLVDRDHEMEKRSSELHIIEAESDADIDLGYKQLHEEEYKELASLESADDQPLSVIAEVGSTQLELEERDLDLREIDSAVLHVLEARSVEDIDSAFKCFRGGDVEKSVPVDSVDDEPEQVESGVGFNEPSPNENDLEVREIHSDVNSGFKQLLEGDPEKSSSLESVNEAKTVEFEVGSAEPKLHMEHMELVELHLDANISEPGMLEDTDIVGNQPHEVNSEQSMYKNSQLLDSVVGYAESTSENHHSKLTEIQSELLVLEARSLEDIDSTFKKMQGGEAVERDLSLESVEEKPHYVESEVGTGNSRLEKPSQPIEIHSDLHVPEASSLSFFDTALDQVEGGLQKSVSVELESKIESSESAPEKKVSGPIEIHLHPHVAEARSLEGIDLALNELHEIGIQKSISLESTDEKPKPLESELVSAEFVQYKEHVEPNDTDSDPLVQEGVSHEDNDSTFKQIHEEDLEKSVSLESGHVGSSGKNDLELIETNSAVQVHETSTVEVIQLVSKQVSEGSDEDPPKPIESEDKPADFEAIERHLEPIILMRSAEEIEAALKESAARESGTSTELSAAKSNKGIVETRDSSSRSSVSKERREKKVSGKSSSSSSSSSGSSDSD